jgi:predicted TIM-barrel enzyme
MAGRGSLAGLMPYGDANAIGLEMAGEVLPVVRDVPVLAGVCGTDPFRLMPRFLDELAAIGFAGVQNFPTVGLIDGVFRQNLEETGISYAAEVEMIRLAAQRRLVNPEILVLCHGGPIAEPADAGYVLARTTGVCGFFGASSMERLPVERALSAQVRAFTQLSFRLSRAGGSRQNSRSPRAMRSTSRWRPCTPPRTPDGGRSG